MVAKPCHLLFFVTVKTFGHIALLAGLSLLFCGCSSTLPARAPGLYVADKSVSIADLKDDDVLLIVNGQPLTKSEYNQRLRIIERVYRIKKSISDKYVTKELRQHLNATAPYIPQEMLAAELVRQGAERAGVEPTEGDLKEAFSIFGNTVGKSKLNEQAIIKRFGADDGVIIVNMITNNARSIAYRRAVATNQCDVVTDEEIAKYINDVKAFNLRSTKLNAKSRALALKVREDILAGKVLFEDAAKKYAKVRPDHGHEWGDFRLAEFEDGSEVRKWLASAKAGDISMPIDLDDGLAIIGVVAVTPAILPPDLPPEDDYTLVKCTFYAYRYIEEQTKEEAREYLRSEKRQAAQLELGRRLYDAAVIEMPNGNQFFSASEKAKKKTKGSKK